MRILHFRLSHLLFTFFLLFLSLPVFCQEEREAEFASRVRLVEVTLQALDGDGRHVLDMRVDELMIRADGRAREIRLFEPVQIGLERFESLKKFGAKYRSLTQAELSDYPPRYYMLLFHQMQFRFGVFQRAREAAVNFVNKHMLPNDRVAVVGFDKQIDFEIDFIDDKAVVIQAIQDMHLKHRNITMRDEFFVYLQNLSMRLAREPYKVSIILIAEGMQGIGGPTSFEVYDNTIRKLQAADVRIYGVDAGGLNLKDPGASVARLSPKMAAKVNQSFNLGLYSGPTGGAYFRYHNNILNLLQQVDYEMSAYYIVGFNLDKDDELDAELSIDISTERKGVDLRYKSRFKATAPME